MRHARHQPFGGAIKSNGRGYSLRRRVLDGEDELLRTINPMLAPRLLMKGFGLVSVPIIAQQ